jgi:hypothetical protein
MTARKLLRKIADDIDCAFPGCGEDEPQDCPTHRRAAALRLIADRLDEAAKLANYNTEMGVACGDVVREVLARLDAPLP